MAVIILRFLRRTAALLIIFVLVSPTLLAQIEKDPIMAAASRNAVKLGIATALPGADLTNYSDFFIGVLAVHNKISKNLTFFEDRSVTTRQIPNASRLYRVNCPGVVLLVGPDGESMGAGCIISQEGEIVTNWHVARNYDQMIAYLYDPKITKLDDIHPDEFVVAEIVAGHPSKDIALLKLTPGKMYPYLRIGADERIDIAQDVFAIGHPENEIWSFTYGVISQLRDQYSWSYSDGSNFVADIIQTQTPINPGNSGGPLFNEKGDLIGINSFRFAESEGLNFAIRIREVSRFIKDARRGLHKPSETWKSKKKEESEWDELDLDDNGRVDAYGKDSNGDGFYDLMWIDENEDGELEYSTGDTNHDHRTDVYIYDRDADGHFEYYLFDTDHDGYFDWIGIDTDRDNYPNEYFPYR